MATFRERFQEAMRLRNMRQVDLCRITGFTSASLSQWNTGVCTPKRDGLIKTAKALNVSVEWLAGEDVPMDRDPVPFESPRVLSDDDVVTFKIIGEVAAGYDSFPLESSEGASVSIPREFLKGRPETDFFALKVVGDSMFPAYVDGDIVLALRQSTLNRSGEVGVVLYDSEYASLKKVEYVYGEDWMKLVPLNPNYPPIVISGADLERCRVFGFPKLLIREIDQ